ncbi:hypothetical protein J4E93_009731 [Alternaria ventricosa]|uniref:uncharacterized protein n=1 Tax=Alternaria ventricosa TaxID=1187951 RepID=UPI0020C1ECC5|nr:uncharacterized protein J4E93_009731 [Alternaria ventricosa]KAI4638703.1 hypothetical protein J4E93_009731 [Alternaria ventricosa]
MEDAGTNNPPTIRKDNEPAARESCLPEEYRSFVAHSKEKDLMRKEAQEKLERMKLDHEKDMWHLKLAFRIQVDDLTRKKEELQTIIDACGKLFGERRDKHTTEIEALTHATELLQSEVCDKAKELKVMYDAHDALVKKLDDGRAELLKKLADAAKHALALQPNAKPSIEAVAAKAAGSIRSCAPQRQI